MSDHDDIGRELHATRAEPTPEFTRELDERAAGWLRDRPRRRRPSLRIAIPAAAAAAGVAAVVVALAVTGGDDGGSELEVAVRPDRGIAEAVGGSDLELEREAAPRAAEGGFAAPRSTRVQQGEPLVVRYFFTAPTAGTVELAGRESSLDVPAGAGRLEISTDELASGAQLLEIKVPAAPLYRQRIEIGG